MCGIVGLAFRDTDRRVDRAVLSRLNAAIRHRGPDDEGVFVSGSVGLAMRRLSIIDLDGGHQPIANEDGSKVIVFNGEIYNYEDLRRELIGRGHRFQTSGDTETILHLYEEMGPRCVERLRGMFAFAIWDAERQQLFLARDRFGIKPLYFVDQPYGIAFASELRALAAAGFSERRLDWEAIDTYLQLGYIPAPATPFTDVSKLEPGHTLTWSPRHGSRITAYWDVPANTGVTPEGDAASAVRRWLDDSVLAHLVSDVPVAAFLSGGIDSSAVVASAAAAGARIEAFTIRYAGAGAAAADESELAQALAQRYGVPLHVIEVGPAATRHMESIVAAIDEPHADDSAIPTWMLSRVVASRFKVALTGAGGDELFGGYRRHLALGPAARYAALPGAVRRLVARLAQRLPEPNDGGLAINRLKRFARIGAESTPGVFLEMLTRATDAGRAELYDRGLRRSISGTWALERFAALHAAGGNRRGADAARYLDYKTFLPDDILALSDRIGMAHGLELRVPFVDHTLVEQAFPLPTRLMMGRRELKALLRRSQRPRLPEAHFSAPKRGFVGPTAAWLRHDLRELLSDELAPERLTRLGYFNPVTVERLLREHSTGRQNHEGILWSLLCFSIWHRQLLERPAPVLDLSDAAPTVRGSATVRHRERDGHG